MIQKRTTTFLAMIAILSLSGLLVGTCAVLSTINFGDQKSNHIFQLPGNAPLTNAELSAYAQKVLVLDERDVANLTPDSFVSSTPTTQLSTQTDSSGAVSLLFRDSKTGWQWF